VNLLMLDTDIFSYITRRRPPSLRCVALRLRVDGGQANMNDGGDTLRHDVRSAMPVSIGSGVRAASSADDAPATARVAARWHA